MLSAVADLRGLAKPFCDPALNDALGKAEARLLQVLVDSQRALEAAEEQGS